MVIDLTDREMGLKNVLAELTREDEVVFFDEKYIYNIFDSASEEGWMYDVYDIKVCTKDENGEYLLDDIDSLDGGFCTGSAQNAIEMAMEITCSNNQEKVFKKNVSLVDYDEYGLGSAITKISIREKDYYEFLQAYENACKGKIKCFDVSDWFHCDPNKIYEHKGIISEEELANVDKEELSEMIKEGFIPFDSRSDVLNIDFLSKHEARCQYVSFLFDCAYNTVSVQILFKHTNGSFDGDSLISLKELEDFFGKKGFSIENMSLETLDRDDLLYFIGEYNNYIVNFDYENSGEPVCAYEFFENEFQEIINNQEAQNV